MQPKFSLHLLALRLDFSLGHLWQTERHLAEAKFIFFFFGDEMRIVAHELVIETFIVFVEQLVVEQILHNVVNLSILLNMADIEAVLLAVVGILGCGILARLKWTEVWRVGHGIVVRLLLIFVSRLVKINHRDILVALHSLDCLLCELSGVQQVLLRKSQVLP